MHRFQPADIVEALRGLAGLPGISVGAPASLAQALDRVLAGMDFADALHLASARGCQSFLSFDRTLAALTLRCPTVPLELPGLAEPAATCDPGVVREAEISEEGPSWPRVR